MFFSEKKNKFSFFLRKGEHREFGGGAIAFAYLRRKPPRVYWRPEGLKHNPVLDKTDAELMALQVAYQHMKCETKSQPAKKNILNIWLLLKLQADENSYRYFWVRKKHEEDTVSSLLALSPKRDWRYFLLKIPLSTLVLEVSADLGRNLFLPYVISHSHVISHKLTK